MKLAAYYVGLIIALLLIGWASGWHQSTVAQGFCDMWCWRGDRYVSGPGYVIGGVAAMASMIVFAIVVFLAVMIPLASSDDDKPANS